MFSTNFASDIHCPSFESQGQKESSQLKWKEYKSERESDQVFQSFLNSPWFCLLNDCTSSWATSQKPTRKVSISSNCRLSRKLSFRKSILGIQLLLLWLQPLSRVAPPQEKWILPLTVELQAWWCPFFWCTISPSYLPFLIVNQQVVY